MIRAFAADGERLRLLEGMGAQHDRILWADLIVPTREEEAKVEAWLGVGVPTREEMEEIEISSRLYSENGAAFMTATLPANTDDDNPEMAPVTFVLSDNRLATIRYHEPRAFHTFPQRLVKAATGCDGGDAILIGLLEAIVDRLADVLERAGRDIDAISHDVFRTAMPSGSKRAKSFQDTLQAIGRKGDLASNIRDSLMTLQRLSGFLGNVVSPSMRNGKDSRAQVRMLSRDIQSLIDHASFLSQKITFLLDATLGMISNEQNAIIKIVSVAALVFLPPTLVASIYGMNFDVMPELKWALGYPFALLLMGVSAILPYWFFRHRGWL